MTSLPVPVSPRIRTGVRVCESCGNRHYGRADTSLGIVIAGDSQSTALDLREIQSARIDPDDASGAAHDMGREREQGGKKIGVLTGRRTGEAATRRLAGRPMRDPETDETHRVSKAKKW